MGKVIGILVVIFALALFFAFIVPDQRDLGPVEVVDEAVQFITDMEISTFNHLEYALLESGRYLAVLDPGGFEGERHGGALTIFDTLNAAIVERFDNVAGFAPFSTSESEILFSARAGLEFRLFTYSIETGLSRDLGIVGGQGGIVLFENGELYMSSNAISKNYLDFENGEELNYFGASDWAIVKAATGKVIDAIDGLDFSLDEVSPKIYPIFGDDRELVSSNNVTLLKEGDFFLLRLEK